jgi:hypothetical protein
MRVTGMLRSIGDALGVALILFAVYAGRGSGPVAAQLVPPKQF